MVDTPSYWQVHNRLRLERGRASEHTCECGAPAKDWAYLGGDEGILSTRGTGIGQRYSTDIHRDYRAMCRSCHHRHDWPEAGRPWLHSPETRAKNLEAVRASSSKRGSTVTNAMRRRCETCGKVSTPGPMALHQAKTGHRGVEKA